MSIAEQVAAEHQMHGIYARCACGHSGNHARHVAEVTERAVVDRIAAYMAQSIRIAEGRGPK